ncbi:MAG TPA: gamma-glutamylcyclotransferase family protein [Gemmatimonadaceae bacterium]|nr:gamma-glutamylcyclotransferase family protein [Gemmatimonadaceae bacterium]
MKYFSYGSNMASARMAERVGRPVSFRRATLYGYRRAFNKPMWEDPAHGYANIVPAMGEKISGVLFDCTAEDLKELDVHEGVADNHYARREVTVDCDGHYERAIVYVACVPVDAPSLRSTPEYVRMILDGAIEHQFSGDEVEAIVAAAGLSGQVTT